MRRWSLLVGAAVSLVFAVLVTGAPASPSQPAAAPTFELVSAPTCATGTTSLGRACVDRPTITNWTPIADGNAQWNQPNQWLTTYSWTVPQTIPPAGAPLTMNLGAEERTGRPGNRICPAMGARSGFGFKEEPAQPVILGFCAEQPAQPTRTGSKTVTLVPPASAPAGSTLTLSIGLQDGPNYTYTYRAKAPVCRRPKSLASAAAAQQECKGTIRFVFTQGGRPAGAGTRVLDIRTVGSGSASMGVNDSGDVITGSVRFKAVRIVRERDYHEVGVPGIGTQRLVLGLNARKQPAYVRQGAQRSLYIPLLVKSSSDPSCTVQTAGRVRQGDLVLRDGGGAAKDRVLLRVERCRWHNFDFEGRKRVKVAIAVK